MKYTLSNDTVTLMNMLLMPIAAMLVITAFFYSSLDTYEAALFHRYFTYMTESIAMSLTIAVGGGLLFDIELKKRGHSSSDKS